MAAKMHSVCSRCGKPRESVDEEWYRVTCHGRDSPYVGDYIGVVAQWCKGCWVEACRRLGEETKAEPGQETAIGWDQQKAWRDAHERGLHDRIYEDCPACLEVLGGTT